MMDFHSRLRNLITPVVGDVKVVYEMFRKREDIPCISYQEMLNGCFFHGDTLQYSDIAYRINVWAESIKEVQELCIKIDDVLQNNGFTRVASNELTEGGLVYKSMTYQGIGREY